MRRLLLLLLLLPLLPLVLAASPARAEEAPPPTGVLTRPPEILEFVEATFPREAEEQKLTGDVVLEVDLSDAGAVTDARVIQPAGHGFDEAALEAVRRFKFSPAEVDGKPAPVTITYRYSFVFKPPPEPPPPDPTVAPAAAPRPSVVNFTGEVVTRGTKQPIAGAAVDIGGGAFTATTDGDGRFELADVPPGVHRVVIVVEGHERFETDEEVLAGQVTKARYYVRRRGGTGFEGHVRAQKERKEVTRIAVTAEEIRTVPGTNGDTIRIVQNLPGVARAPYGFGVLLVRGGAPQDTRAYIDGQFVPLIFHFGGVRSVYASELVSDVQFYAGNFGSRFGRAIGGAVEVVTRDPGTERLHLVGDVSLIDALALAEGPVTEDLAVAAAVRRSYVDAILVQVLPENVGVSFLVAPRYYDYQLKTVYRISKNEKLVTNFFGSEDKLGFLIEDPQEFDPEARGNFTNLTRFHRLMAAWEKKVGDLTHRLEVGPSFDHFEVDTGQDLGFTLDWTGGAFRDDWSWDASKELTLSAGLDVLAGAGMYDTVFLQPPQQGQVPVPIAGAHLAQSRSEFAFAAPAVWVEAVIRPHPSVKLVPGLREDYDGFMDDFWTDVRLASFWAPTDSTTVKGAAGLYHQPPQYPAMFEGLGNPDLIPEGAWQYMVGGEQKLGDHLSIDLQLYYKKLFHLTNLSSRTVVRDGIAQPERFASDGNGRSYGSELLVRWANDERFFGWLAYTLSRSERISAFTGEMTTFALDQPHNLTLVASYLIQDWDLQVGTRIRYATGNPTTPFVSRIYDGDGDRYLPIPGMPYSERVPDFFQADLRVDRHFWFPDWRLSIYLDVQNVTYVSNVEALRYNYDFTEPTTISSLPIVPSLGIRVEY